MLKFTGATAGAVAVGTALAAPQASAAGASLVHPGLLHTRTDLDRMAKQVKAGAAPYTAGFARLTANRHAQSGWTANPQATVYRGEGSPQNYAILYNDIHAAYQNALRLHVTGESAYGNTAVAILNAWSAKLTALEGSADRFLAAGLYGYQFANAAELVRDHADFDLARFQKMMLDVFHPLSEDFLANHNGAVITNYWANWDLTAIACVLAVGILCDDRAKIDRAVEYFKHGAGMGSVKNAIPVVHEGQGLAEWVEAGGTRGTRCSAWVSWARSARWRGTRASTCTATTTAVSSRAPSMWPSGAWAATCRTRPTPVRRVRSTAGRAARARPGPPPWTRR